MAKHKTKLELTWIGKENRPKLEPRSRRQLYRLIEKGGQILQKR